MVSGRKRRLSTVAILMGIALLLAGAAACSGGDSETVDFLQDPKFGLAHLNDEFHTIKG